MIQGQAGLFVLEQTSAVPCVPELLWTAPEILRSGYPGLHGTPHGDVYSFAIIMQEVVIRGPPFCMLDFSAAGKTTTIQILKMQESRYPISKDPRSISSNLQQSLDQVLLFLQANC